LIPKRHLQIDAKQDIIKPVKVKIFTNKFIDVIGGCSVLDKVGRPWVIAVLVLYMALIGSLLIFAKAPWNWILALVVSGKAFGFLTLIRRVDAIGGGDPAARPPGLAARMPARPAPLAGGAPAPLPGPEAAGLAESSDSRRSR
jgi:hypothetical protein